MHVLAFYKELLHAAFAFVRYNTCAQPESGRGQDSVNMRWSSGRGGFVKLLSRPGSLALEFICRLNSGAAAALLSVALRQAVRTTKNPGTKARMLGRSSSNSSTEEQEKST